MRAWAVHQPGPMATGPLRMIDRPRPGPGPGELLIRVLCCGVCRTDLHLAEGDLAPKAPDITPGHEVVGEVAAAGPGTVRFTAGDRVGVAWLAGTDGSCRYCRRGNENLCPRSVYTGWDLDGGYAEYVVAADAYVHHLPAGFSDAEAAPLLCAGIIGYRALRRADLPPGGRLGIWGFGGSARLTAQIALAQGAAVHVFTRAPAARELALELGTASAQDSYDPAPEPLDSAIIFAPVGELVPTALAALDRRDKVLETLEARSHSFSSDANLLPRRSRESLSYRHPLSPAPRGSRSCTRSRCPETVRWEGCRRGSRAARRAATG